MKHVSLLSLLLMIGSINCSEDAEKAEDAAYVKLEKYRVALNDTEEHKAYVAQCETCFKLENIERFLKIKCLESQQPWFGQSEECFRSEQQQKLCKSCRNQAKYLEDLANKTEQGKKWLKYNKKLTELLLLKHYKE